MLVVFEQASEPPPAAVAAVAGDNSAGAIGSVVAVPTLVVPPPAETAESDTFFTYKPLEKVVRSVREVLAPAALEVFDAFVAPFDAGLLWEDLGELRSEIQGDADVPFFVAGSAAGFTSTLTVGYVLWTIRSGWLVTSLLAQMPAWRLVDPLAVLDCLGDGSAEERKDEDDSLESLLEGTDSDDEQAEDPPQADCELNQNE